MPRITNLMFAGGVGLIAIMVLVAAGRATLRDDSPPARDEMARRAHLPGAEPLDAGTAGSLPRSPGPFDVGPFDVGPFDVIIRQPSGPPRIELAGVDPQGRSGSVACSTCHAVRAPDLGNISAATLDEFHQGMRFNHGKIACYACHHPGESDALRLADGSSLAYENVMTLCSQCHSKQAESFAHGAHGGMNGHWDMSRGPQVKHNCIDCHDPHWPAYPKMIVGFKPKDRFNAPLDHHRDPQGADSHDAP